MQPARGTGHGVWDKLRRNRVLLVMIAPAVLFFLVNNYIPMAGIILAFKEYNFRGGIFFSPWAGLGNFRFLFLSGEVFAALRNTVLYNLSFLVLENFAGILLAIFLSELTAVHFRKVAQALLFLPYILSWVVIGAISFNFFNYEFGAINTVLKSFGMSPVNFYGETAAWPFIIAAFDVWKGAGYASVLYLATIVGIDQELHEAAQIDGAHIFDRIRHITIPHVKPTLVTLVLLAVGRIFSGNFQMFFQLVGNNSILYPSTDVIDTLVTRMLMSSNEIGFAAAAGLIQSVFGFVVIMVVNAAVRHFDHENALF